MTLQPAETPTANFRAQLCASFVTLLILMVLSGVTARIQGQSLSPGGRQYHVSPGGLPSNDGSAARPLDLVTALSSSGPARPGDTIWLHGGTYRGAFTSSLTGTAAAPIVVRQFPGERATIDSSTAATDALSVRGGHTWFWGFEITSSDPKRISAEPGSWPSDLRRGYGAVTRAPGIKFINLIVHDNANGLGLWAESVDSEAYGNLTYYNGWEAPDRAHGHGIYTQNQVRVRRIADNILFDQFSHGVHAYGSGAASLDNITLQGNIAFRNGAISAGGMFVDGRELLLGGYRAAANAIIDSNATYANQSNFGYSAGCTNGRITNNYFAGAVLLIACDAVITGNSFYDMNWPRYGTWPTQYPQNTFHTALPPGPVVRVRPNEYEPGRAHVVIYNWTHQPHVAVDLSDARLADGTAFEIRDAQNYFGAPVVQGVYTGSPVTIPMTGLTAVRPVGNVPTLPTHTAPEFAAFVVVPATGTAAPVPPAPAPAPVVTLAASTTSISQGQSSTLSWSTSGAVGVSIDQGVGTVAASGSVQVVPVLTTTYTATAIGADGQTATSQVTVTVTAASEPPPPPAPTLRLTAPAAGQAFTAPATVTIAAAAVDPAATISRVVFSVNGAVLGEASQQPYSTAWTPSLAGPYVLTAQAFGPSGVVASAPAVSVTVSAATSTPPPSGPVTVRMTAPSQNAVFVNQSTASLSAEVTDPAGSVTRVEFYRGASHIASSYSRPYAVQWTHVTPGTYPITARVYTKTGVVATSAAVTVFVTYPPTVQLTSPAAGVHAAPTSLTLTATAADQDGTIAYVDFYEDSTLLGRKTSAPFTISWSAAPEGTHVLTARAYDNRGTVTVSRPVSVTVNVPPTVHLVAPSQTGTYVNQGTITLEAAAADAGGRVTRVEFYRGTAIIGTVTTSPYRLNWTNVVTGTYTLTAKAYDDKGSVTQSAPTTIVVRPR